VPIFEPDSQSNYNVTLRSFRVTTVVVGKQEMLHIQNFQVRHRFVLTGSQVWINADTAAKISILFSNAYLAFSQTNCII
jgi:hypothetical protein